ncbi:chemotaxis protein CheW [Hahella sp. HN01]|uniref:chemotaxis protein CheW n=1 Tax=unclassified Hahella TaxID=2624107 RepID=UPI001C1EA443|nr:chemotaxis protein CheW [Hahella sp. HN01]MBU6954274.1 chemotaxis protein CheW [Hahella sp. HN01]
MDKRQNAQQSADNNLQFLTFWLGDESYGLDILRVREIRGWNRPREIPNVPRYIKGVIDFRGGIVPIVDLRVRFALPKADYDRETVVIIVSVELDKADGAEHHTMGMVVDRVADVMDVAEKDIKARPQLGSKLDTRYLTGVVNRNEGMVVLIDVDKLLDPETFTQMESWSKE